MKHVKAAVVADLLLLLVGPAEEKEMIGDIHEVISNFSRRSGSSRRRLVSRYERIPTTSLAGVWLVRPKVAIFSPFACA
jgi:hypothetical protein